MPQKMPQQNHARQILPPRLAVFYYSLAAAGHCGQTSQGLENRQLCFPNLGKLSARGLIGGAPGVFSAQQRTTP